MNSSNIFTNLSLEEKDTLRVFLDFYMGYNWYSRIGEESEYLLLWEKGFFGFFYSLA